MKEGLNRSTHHVDSVGCRPTFPKSELSTAEVRLYSVSNARVPSLT